MTTEETWKRLGDILSEIEWYDKATNGQFRQPEDSEARRILNRIERKMKRQMAKDKKA